MFEKWGLFKLARRTYSCLNSPDFGRCGSIASCFASVMKQFPAEAADLFKAAEDNAKWRYRSYQRMLSTDWSKPAAE